MPKRYTNNVVLAFGDSHFPYEHKDAFNFLEYIKKKYDPDRVIHMGDLFDIYSVSSYPVDPDHPDTWDQEIRQARKKAERLAELFPEMDIMESNHDDRIYKKARLAGIPREALVSYRKIVGAPDGWTWHPDLSITVDSTREQLYFAHTKTGGSLNLAKDLNCTSFLGHAHSKFGATAFRPSKNKVIWGVDVGCLVSDKGAPYAYNKGDRGRPITGCCIVINGTPIMELLN